MRHSFLARERDEVRHRPYSNGHRRILRGRSLGELVATAPLSARVEGTGGWGNISSEVQAAAAYNGASDFTVGALQFQHHTGQVMVKLFRGTEKEKPELYRKASPIFYVSKNTPPL